MKYLFKKHDLYTYLRYSQGWPLLVLFEWFMFYQWAWFISSTDYWAGFSLDEFKDSGLTTVFLLLNQDGDFLMYLSLPCEGSYLAKFCWIGSLSERLDMFRDVFSVPVTYLHSSFGIFQSPPSQLPDSCCLALTEGKIEGYHRKLDNQLIK